MKFQTETEPAAFPPLPAVWYAHSRLKSLVVVHAFPARVMNILIRQTTNVRDVQSDMCKIPATRTIRPAWFVRTVKVEQVHNFHARIVPPDSLAPAPVFAGHARASQYQQAPGTPLAQLAPATESQTPAKHSVSVPREKEAPWECPALVRHVPAIKFQTRRIEPHAFPHRPAVSYARSRLKSLAAEDASLAPITSILMRQTTHV